MYSFANERTQALAFEVQHQLHDDDDDNNMQAKGMLHHPPPNSIHVVFLSQCGHAAEQGEASGVIGVRDMHIGDQAGNVRPGRCSGPAKLPPYMTV